MVTEVGFDIGVPPGPPGVQTVDVGLVERLHLLELHDRVGVLAGVDHGQLVGRDPRVDLGEPVLRVALQGVGQGALEVRDLLDPLPQLEEDPVRVVLRDPGGVRRPGWR